MPGTKRAYSLRAATLADANFACEVKLRGLQPYVEAYAPWDEGRQRASFLKAYDHASTRIVQAGGEDVGVLRTMDRGDDVYLAEIYLAASVQNLGLGSAIVQDVVASAHARGRSVVLQLLRTNPVVRLYERLGFRVCAETVTHYHMECPCPKVREGGSRE